MARKFVNFTPEQFYVLDVLEPLMLATTDKKPKTEFERQIQIAIQRLLELKVLEPSKIKVEGYGDQHFCRMTEYGWKCFKAAHKVFDAGGEAAVQKAHCSGEELYVPIRHTPFTDAMWKKYYGIYNKGGYDAIRQKAPKSC